MTNFTPTTVDFETLVREARMERSLAIGNAIGDGIAAIARGFELLIAKVSGLHTARPAQQPR
jgi:hypothetical protein